MVPSKYLMNFSLGYFVMEDLEKMLKYIILISAKKFCFLLTETPDDSLKWNFYNTEERKNKYYENIANDDTSNAGIGKWWNRNEIISICEALNLKCEFYSPDLQLSNYKMDIMISNPK